ILRRGVLGDHQQFFNPGLHQSLRLAHHLPYGPADQLATHIRDDAEAAAVVAALGDLEIRIMTRRKLHPLGWHQIGKWIMDSTRREMLMHLAQDRLIGMGAGNAKYIGMHLS